VRPGRLQFPVTGCGDCLVLILSVAPFQDLQDLIVKTSYPAHRKHGCQHPVFVAPQIGCHDCLLVPWLGGSHRGFQSSPPHCLGIAAIEVDPVKRVLNVAEDALGNRYVIWIVEPVDVSLFEYRPEGNRRSGPQFFRLVNTTYDRQSRIRQSVVDDGRIACQLGGNQSVGLFGRAINQDLLKRLCGISWPVPGRCDYQSLKIHFDPPHFSLIAGSRGPQHNSSIRKSELWGNISPAGVKFYVFLLKADVVDDSPFVQLTANSCSTTGEHEEY
jgi:hypothetical protein